MKTTAHLFSHHLHHCAFTQAAVTVGKTCHSRPHTHPEVFTKPTPSGSSPIPRYLKPFQHILLNHAHLVTPSSGFTQQPLEKLDEAPGGRHGNYQPEVSAFTRSLWVLSTCQHCTHAGVRPRTNQTFSALFQSSCNSSWSSKDLGLLHLHISRCCQLCVIHWSSTTHVLLSHRKDGWIDRD